MYVYINVSMMVFPLQKREGWDLYKPEMLIKTFFNDIHFGKLILQQDESFWIFGVVFCDTDSKGIWDMTSALALAAPFPPRTKL